MKAIIKKVLIFMMWYLLRIFIKIFPLNIIYILGRVGGRLLYLMSKEKRNIMDEELRLVMPDKSAAEIEDIVKGSFENYCLSEMEVLLYPILNSRLIQKITTIEGKEHLDNALSKGRGVLLFQAHFGAFQMTMAAIGYSGYKMNQVSASADVWKDSNTSKIQTNKAFDMKAELEYSLPVHHISVKSFIRPALRALGNNEIVGITVDGGGGKKVVQVKFLGRNANLPQGGAYMAVKTGAMIVPAFIVSEKSLRHRLILHPPIEASNKLNINENIQCILQEFARILESYVYRYSFHYGYYLYLRKALVSLDLHPFFTDYDTYSDSEKYSGEKATDYV